MKGYRLFFLVVIFTLLLPAYSFSEMMGRIRLSLIEGDVQTKTPDAGEWFASSVNGPLEEGDEVWVPDGARAELQLNDGTYIRLDSNSALQILSADRDSSQFYLSQGHAYVYFNAPRGSVIQFDTPDASTHAYDRAVYRIDMTDQSSIVAVYKGYVDTENRVGQTRVNAGDSLELGQDTTGELAPLGPPDDWEAWNKERNDRLIARGPSARYLPSELDVYSSDFDSNGRWVVTPDYGRCWIPTVGISVGWAPYHSGRWIWRGGNYVWVSYEPWGWAPYHYGRWAFVTNYGWCWVPPVAGAVYWGPGFVGWVSTPDYVAWVPLAPGEVYYGRGYYGPNSVNVTNININTVRVTNVYKNVNINNGVTVVTHNTFVTGRPQPVNLQQNFIRQNLFTRNNITNNIRVAGPGIKPQKTSYMPVVKQVPSAKLPPQHIRSVQVNTLKQQRPFVKQQGRSVLNPGARPKPLEVRKLNQPKAFRPQAQRPGGAQPRGGREVQPGVQQRQGGPQPREGREVQPGVQQRQGGPQPRGGREVQPGVEHRQGGPAGPQPGGGRPAEKKKQAPEGQEKKEKPE